MKMKEDFWVYEDRSQWNRPEVAAGEPDKAQWEDKETGLPCLIVRGPVGALCGYVGVRKGHPFYEIKYGDCSHKSGYLKGKRDGDTKMPLIEKVMEEDSFFVKHQREKRICNEEDEWCDHRPEHLVEVHGGLTYSGFCQKSSKHPEGGICHVTEGEDKVWWLGFDCAHLGDFAPKSLPLSLVKELGTSIHDQDVYRDFNYVKEECRKLAAQLAAIS